MIPCESSPKSCPDSGVISAVSPCSVSTDSSSPSLPVPHADPKLMSSSSSRSQLQQKTCLHIINFMFHLIPLFSLLPQFIPRAFLTLPMRCELSISERQGWCQKGEICIIMVNNPENGKLHGTERWRGRSGYVSSSSMPGSYRFYSVSKITQRISKHM